MQRLSRAGIDALITERSKDTQMDSGLHDSDRHWTSEILISLIVVIPLAVGCNEPAEPVTIRGSAVAESGDDQVADAGRGRGGEPLFPLPDEQAAISAIQDAGLPADAVGYGGMRFVETTAAGAAALKGIADLESVTISIKDASDDDLKQLKDLPKVNGLLVLSRHVTDDGLRHIGAVKDLKYLWIEQAQLTAAGLEHLKGLTDLESFNVRFRPLSGGVQHLKQMKKLKALNIPGSKVSDNDLQHLDGLSALESINIGSSLVTDAGIQHLIGLNNLKTLHLRGTPITDDGLKALASLKTLEDVNLVLCRSITDEGIAEFQKSLPNCEVRR